jgi:cytoskeletal protein CcmA (bactofilin family)
LICLAAWLSGCEQAGVYSAKLVLDGDLVIPAGQQESALVAIGTGSLTVKGGGTLVGDIYQIGGTVWIDGIVEGDISALSGDLRIGPTAEIFGDVLLGGSNATVDPSAYIRGELLESASQLPDQGQRNFITDASPGWRLGQAVFLVLLAAALGRGLSAPLKRVAIALFEHWLPSLALGILIFLVGLSLIVQMMFTVILFPVSMLGLALLGIAVLFGWVAAGVAIGKLLARRLSRLSSLPLQAAAGMVVLLLVQGVLAVLPGFGAGILIIPLSIASLGAVGLTRFGLVRFIPADQRQDPD